MRARVITIRNKASSKNNAACTSTDDLIVKNMLNHPLMKRNHVLMKKNHALTKKNHVLMRKNHVLK